MSLQRIEYPDLGVDIEVEQLGSIFKFFKHKHTSYFGQCVVSTGEIGDGVLKGLMSPRMSFNERKKLDDAIRRTLDSMGYQTGIYQRKIKGGKFRSRRAPTRRVLSN
jgi:hypothetical protein